MAIRMTRHARMRMAEMRLSIDDVLGVINSPDVEYSQTYRGQEQIVAQKGDVALVYGSDGQAKVVFTIMPRTTDQYKRKWTDKGGI